MINKILLAILSIVLLMFIILFYSEYSLNQDNYRQIESRDSLLREILIQDTLTEIKTKQYSEIITKYVNNCEFTIDNVKVSTSDIVMLFNKSIDEANKLRDSIFYYKQLYLSAQKDYGFNYRLKKQDSSNYYIQKEFTKLDSALLIYPFYKENLKYNSANGYWVVTHHQKIIENPIKEKK